MKGRKCVRNFTIELIHERLRILVGPLKLRFRDVHNYNLSFISLTIGLISIGY